MSPGSRRCTLLIQIMWITKWITAHPNHNEPRFKEMHRQDPSLIFPMLVWDTFPRSGASQVNHRLVIITLSLSHKMLVGKTTFLLKQSIKFSSLFFFLFRLFVNKSSNFLRFTPICRPGWAELDILDILKHSSGSNLLQSIQKNQIPTYTKYINIFFV